ncbi:MAG: sulfotransferase [Bacteroidota bacterium]
MRTQRIHIVSCGPRTGTTLLAEAMRVCFDVDAWEDHEAGIFHRAPVGARAYLTKHPGDIFRVGPRLRVDPDFHVVYLLRDPRDIVTSRHRKAPDRYWASLRYWTTYTPEGDRLASHPRFTTVRYEDFASDPDAIQDRLAEALPFLRATTPFSRYHEAAVPSEDSVLALRGVRPIRPDSVGTWRDHLPRVKGQIEIHGSITDYLVRYGYEADSSWEACLDGVEPDLAPGYFGEHFRAGAVSRLQSGRYRAAAKAVLRRLGVPGLRP